MIALLTIPLIISNYLTLRQLEAKLLAPLPSDNNYPNNVDALVYYANPRTPKITFGKGQGQPITHLSMSDRQWQHFTTNETKLVLICESTVPTRWLWTPRDWLSTRVDIQVDKRRTEVSGQQLYRSWLTMDFFAVQTFVSVKENYTAKVNVSCVNPVQNSSLNPVTCVRITFDGYAGPGLSEMLKVGIDNNALVQNCVILVGLNSEANCVYEPGYRYLLGIPSLNYLKGPCMPEPSGTWGFCAELGFCKSGDIRNVGNDSCQVANETMTQHYNRGFAWHILGYPNNDYCGLGTITNLKSGQPAPILYFPGDAINKGSGNGTDLVSANIIQSTKQDSIEILEMGPGVIKLLEGGVARHEFEENETVEFFCKAIWNLKEFRFIVGTNNSSRKVVSGTQPLEMKSNANEHILIQNVTLSSEVYGQISWISCAGYAYSSWRPIRFSSTINVSIHPGESPFANLTVHELKDEDLIIFNCSYGGRPRPNLTWILSDEVGLVSVGPSDESHNGHWSQVRGISISNSSNFNLNVTCIAQNIYGSDQSRVHMKGIDNAPSTLSFIGEAIGLSTFGGILLPIMLTVFLYVRKRQRLSMRQTNQKEAGPVQENISLQEIKNPPQSSAIVEAKAKDDTGPLLRPQNQSKYELLPDEFTILEARLGDGEFGEVYRGKVIRRGEKKERSVAVKMPLRPFTEAAVKGLREEFNILACLGKHLHVIEMIGVYTAQLEHNIMYLFLELCELGSLLSYLKKWEPVEQMGTLEVSSYVMPMEIPSVADDLAEDMRRWAGEIASGMEHIVSKGLLHRDLATRNILLTVDKRVKIIDFGLTRPMNESQTYVKKTNNPLPWKWMAPECLPLPGRTQFTEKSEVWSFGITLWEIYSFGRVPYPKAAYTEVLASWLEQSPENRLSEPKYCRDNMYSVMRRCWQKDPKDRPTLTELIRILRDNATENRLEFG